MFGRREGNVPPQPFHTPYKDPRFNGLYNLLFCDNPSLFTKVAAPTAPSHDVIRIVLYDPPDRARLEQVGNDSEVESRYRMLAFYRLRSMNLPVPPKRLLGIIVECQRPLGLDVLAGYVDGRVRYINQAEKMFICEPSAPPAVANVARALTSVSQTAVDQFPFSNLPRQARCSPPVNDRFRITFLASDGPYIAEASYAALIKDRLVGPVVAFASLLLKASVEIALKEGRSASTVLKEIEQLRSPPHG